MLKLTKKSIADKYLLINLFIIGRYCLTIRVLIPPSFNNAPAYSKYCLSTNNVSYSVLFRSSSVRNSDSRTLSSSDVSTLEESSVISAIILLMYLLIAVMVD